MIKQKWHREILPTATRKAISLLQEQRLLEGFYLAGGTGLSLQLGHRLSADLDFFSEKEVHEDRLLNLFAKEGGFTVTQKEKETLSGVFSDTKLSFMGYHYPLLFPLKEYEGLQVADMRDIACMKLSALASRGAKRDFVDIFIFCREVMSLSDLLLLFFKKYQKTAYNEVHIQKSLLYFEDAQEEVMPDMLIDLEWEEVKAFFERETQKFGVTL